MEKTAKKSKSKQNLYIMAEAAIMLALSTVLSEFTQIPFTFGGSVTLFSQLPIIILSYRHGLKWGIGTSVMMGIIQLIFGLNNYAYIAHTFGTVLIFILFDYIIAFGVLGLGGMYRKIIKNQTRAIIAGAVTVSFMRYVCHFISGVTIWADYASAESTWAVFAYSLSYNAGYMVPEAIITIIGGFALSALFDLSKPNLSRRRKG